MALGQAYLHRGWWDEALVELRKAQNLKPGLKDIHFHLAQVYRFKSWWDEAVSEYEKQIAVTTDPEAVAMCKDLIQQVLAWKEQLLVSPSAGNSKLIK